MRTAVLGLGLIGGSVARALPDVVGFDPEQGAAARSDGLEVADTVEQAVEGADLVVLAAPVPANDALLARLPPSCLVTDVGSVKEPLVRAWERLPSPPALVPGHPMAGAETAGWAASRPDLFAGARWVLCPGPWATAAQWLRVCELVLGLGAVVVPAGPARHDRAAAAISHAPHLVAAALAAAAADAGPLALALAAGSFRDLTRITASPPARTAAFCRANALPAAAALQQVVDRLQDAVTALTDGGDVLDLLTAGRDARARYDTQARDDSQARDDTRARDDPALPTEETTVTLDPDDPDWAAPLLALGEAGGVVTGATGSHLTVRR